MQNFNAFGLPAVLLQSLDQMGITVPTPIQVEAIPPILEGTDLLASAQTGTGKTMAYLLPIISKLEQSTDDSILILTPTRELATQVKDTALQLIKRIRSLNLALLIGGEPIFKQFAALKRRPRIIIGTPGRILDHLQRRTLHLQSVKYLVLDETDRMLDMGFSQDIETILTHLQSERQTLLFSATLPQAIVKLSKKYLALDAKRIAIGSTTEPSRQIKQETVQVSSGNKFSTLLSALDEREGSVIIFVKTKISADRLAEKLQEKDHAADAIHGDLNQRRRDRVIREFRNNKCRILVATDIAARGLDIPHIMHVVNYDLPQCPEDYIHRIGRTGRAGMTGFALSFVSPEERHKWKAIHRLIHAGEETESQYRRAPSRGGKSDGRRGGYQGKRDDNRGGYKGKSNGESRRYPSQRDQDGESRGYRGKSEGSSERPYRARSEGSSERPYRARSEGSSERPYRARSEGSSERPYRARSEGSSERPYRARSEGSSERSYRGKSEGSSERPYRSKSEGSSERSYRAKSEGSSERSYRAKSEGSSERPYRAKSEGSSERPYRAKSEGSSERPYRAKSEGSSERPYRAKSEGSVQRSYRSKSESDSAPKSFRGKKPEGTSARREYVNPKAGEGVRKKRATVAYSGASRFASAKDEM
ncbi:MAG: DEAD/DEAH box helicase [Candidatus Berkiella sp.]